MKKIIELTNISFQYPTINTTLFKDFSLSFFQGQYATVVGANGSGKSTLLQLIIGLLMPSKGEITIDEKFGVVFQNPENQFVGSTVEDDVAFGLENLMVQRQAMKPIIEESLLAVNMIDFIQRDPFTLSGGQKQRVALASAIALAPSILLLDEATSMLDPTGRNEFQAAIQKLRKQNDKLTIISITHDMEEVNESDRTILLDNGQLIFDGQAQQLFADEQLVMNHHLKFPFEQELKQQLIKKGASIDATQGIKEWWGVS